MSTEVIWDTGPQTLRKIVNILNHFGCSEAANIVRAVAVEKEREPVRLTLEEVLNLTRPDESRPMHQAEYMRFARDIEQAVLKANGLLVENNNNT